MGERGMKHVKPLSMQDHTRGTMPINDHTRPLKILDSSNERDKAETRDPEGLWWE
jgi:hypothetical protein